MRVFSETQKFTQWWLRLINFCLVAFLLYCFHMWFIAKESVGNVPKDGSDGQLIVLFSTIPILLLFYFMGMKTTIDEIGIHYQFFPFHLSQRIIRWADMEKCYTRTYSPIREYGGWGLRGSFGKNKAYNVKGNKGIQTVLKSGEKVLIGTQKENEAQKVIDRHFKKNLGNLQA